MSRAHGFFVVVTVWERVLMDYTEIIDRLDRRYAYITGQEGQTFLLELYSFIEDLLSDPAFLPILWGFIEQYRATIAQLQDQSQVDRTALENLLQRLLALASSLQTEVEEPAPTADAGPSQVIQTYTTRLARLLFVKDVIAGRSSLPQRESTGPRSFLDLPEDRALCMLLDRLGRLDDTTKVSQAWQTLMADVLNAKERRDHVVRRIRLREPIHAYSALKWLLDVYNALNPQPLGAGTLQARMVRHMQVHPFDAEWSVSLRRVAFDGAPFARNVEPELRQALARLHHHLRAGMDHHRNWDSLIKQYQQRSQWYDRSRLHALGNTPDRGEDTLSDDLARFMFDRGVPVLVRHSFGGHVPDLVGPEDAGLVIEAKAYHEDCRTQLVSGFAQLASYMQTLSGSRYAARVGYYVVFRLDGPLYPFDQGIHLGPVVVHPILIDVGPSGGRARRAVRPISAAEVLERIRPPATAEPA
jgi:hypothetical protein